MKILAHMRERGLRFRCLWREPNVEWVASRANMSGIRPGLYGRQTRVQCFEGSERVEAGEYLTSVVFWDTRAMCKNCGNTSLFSGSTAQDIARSGVEQHVHFQGYFVPDSGASEMIYLFGNKYDSYIWTSYPMRPETFYCAFGSKFSTPFVCSHELPGCRQPRYPEPTAIAPLRGVFAAWALIVYLSYFHTLVFFGAQFLLGVAMMVYCCTRCRWRQAHPPAKVRTEGGGLAALL